MSLNKKMIFFLFLPLLVCALIGGTLTYVQIKSTVEPIVYDAAVEIASNNAAALQNYLNSILQTMLSLAERDILQTLNWDQIAPAFFQTLRDRPQLIDFIVLYSSGYAYSVGRSDNDVRIGQPVYLGDRSYFKELFIEKKPYVITNPILSRVSNFPMFAVLVPIKNPAKEVIAVLGTSVTLTYFSEMVGRIRLGKTGFGWVVDNTGLIVAHPEKEYIMKLKLSEASTVGFSGLDQPENSILSGKPGMITIRRPDSKKELVFYAPIELSPGWVLCVSVEESQYLNPVYRILRWISYVFLAIVLIIGVVLLLGSRMIQRPILKIADIAEDLVKGEGDLRIRIPIHANDEIGQMAQRFNAFLDHLEEIMRTVHTSTDTLKQVSHGLSSSITETSAEIHQITATLQSIQNQVSHQTQGITETVSIIEEINKNIESFNQIVENQASIITEASSAIEQMVANIQSVHKSIERNKESIEFLTSSSIVGKERLQGIVKFVRDIAETSKDMEEANRVIMHIAQQTNLLSMNAAIEAAHAGAAGAGFSVVAQEIRKLAEEAGSQTKSISQVLKRVQTLISDAVQFAAEAETKYEEILGGIKKVQDQETEIRYAMEEQSSGSTQVLNAIKQINDITAEIKQGSQEIMQGSQVILKEMQTISALSQNIDQSSKEIAMGASGISQAVVNIRDAMEASKRTTDEVDQWIHKFKTR